MIPQKTDYKCKDCGKKFTAFHTCTGYSYMPGLGDLFSKNSNDSIAGLNPMQVKCKYCGSKKVEKR